MKKLVAVTSAMWLILSDSYRKWLNANRISLNASKTEYIIFKHVRKPLNYDFRLFIINGKRLLPSTSIKYLGVLLDSDLSLKSQINNVANKLKRANGVALAKLRHSVPLTVLRLVYYAIFHSHYNTAKFGVNLILPSLTESVSSKIVQ